MRPGSGRIVAALAVVGVALMAPATAGAATTLGQLRVIPQGVQDCDPGRVYVQRTNTGGIRYQVPAGGGVITSWSVRPALNPNQQGSFQVLRDDGGNNFTVLATSAVQNLNSMENVDTFSVRFPVQGGEWIGYSFPSGSQQQCVLDAAPAGSSTWSGPLASVTTGATFTAAQTHNLLALNLQANLEPDADKDGFGDETQDRCPTQAGTTGSCSVAGGSPPPADRTKPTFGSLSFSRTTFAAAKSGSAFSAQRKRRATPVGTKVSFNLSEAAAVKFTVQRKTTGRRVSGRCKARTRKNRRKARCTLWKNVRGSFTYTGKAGRNSLTFRGRIGGRALRTGSYRLNGTATDPAKNASAPRNKSFRIVR
ncbi:MAG TPA: hypothetical protein VFY44_00660 [Thermoleophilaceae bacterium]|nr:hypothetical protein [Thermoleophilaceae bacterium]